MKKSRADLENVKKFVDSTYNRWGNLLVVDCTKDYNPTGETALGYCFKDIDPKTGRVTYRICCSKIGIPRTDFRIMMHEYGHIYLAHMDNIHEELDTQLCNYIRDNRGELIDNINKSCGIDFADKLLERVIDDPQLNHSLHNIAMDMEVNSTILSDEDVEEMEVDLTSVMPKTDIELLQQMIDNSVPESEKEKYQEALDKMKKQAMTKLILPSRYKMGVDASNEPIPFPNNLDYASYLILILKYLDQFIKSQVSIDMGKNGDTSDITQDDIRRAFNSWFQNKSQEYLDGYQKALDDLRNGKSNPNQIDPQYAAGYKDGFEKEMSSGQNGGQDQQNQPSQEYQQGYQDGYNDGMNQNQQSGQNQSSSQSQQGNNGQNSQQSSPSQDQNQQSGQNQSQGSQSGSQSAGQNQQSSSDYQQGYQDGQNAANQQQSGSNGMDPNGQYQPGQNGNSQGQGQAQSSYDQGFQDGQNAAKQAKQGGNQGSQSQGQSNGGNPSQQQGQANNGQGQSDFQQGYMDALRDAANGNIQNPGQPSSGMSGLDNLLSRTGIMQPNNKKGQAKGQGQDQVDGGTSPHDNQKSRAGSGDSDLKKDHRSSSRDEADKKRKLGQIKAGGGTGCGKGAGPDNLREVDPMVDEVDMALKEVMRNVKHRVIKHTDVKDIMRLYNRGIQRKVIVPSITQKVELSVDPKLVFLIDISGSMNTELVDRVLKTISKSLYKLNRGLRYDIITWSTRLGEHMKNLDPKKKIPRISCGGGTDMASGMEYFKNNYDRNAILILISDFEDSLKEWHRVESGMKGYLMYGFNYGYHTYDQEWKYFKQKNFSNYGYD